MGPFSPHRGLAGTGWFAAAGLQERCILLSRMSILITVYNAEAVLERTLKQLATCEIGDSEVIASLDGCTDRSEEIVRRHPFVKVIVNRERLGKTLNNKKLFEASTGDLIFMLDDDHFLFCNRRQFDQLLQLFEADPALGGVVCPIPEVVNVQRHARKIKSALAFGDALLQKFLAEFRIRHYTKAVNGRLYMDREKCGYPFQVVVFRRQAAPFQSTLVDDTERSVQILENGFKVLVLTDDLEYPHATPFPDLEVPQKLTFGGLVRQKTRNMYGITELEHKYKRGLGVQRFYLPFAGYVLLNLVRHPSYVFPVLYASLVFAAATLAGKLIYLKGLDSTKAWGLGIKKRDAWR